MTMRRSDRLVLVAPFYRRRRLGLSSGLQLAGLGASERLTEISEILIADEASRPALRELVDFLFADHGREWDWLELMLGPEQGWFEPAWLPVHAVARGAAFLHKGTKPFVVLDLPQTWEGLRGNLKPNMKEAIRRSVNRLARVDEGWEYLLPADKGEFESALDVLVRLHRARAAVTSHELHANYFEQGQSEAFIRDAALAMFVAGVGTVARVRIGGVDAAARLVLHGNDSTFFSFSGLDPAYWEYGPGTALMVEALRSAIARGEHVANLSQHPETSKLRWSERLELRHEFLVIAPRRRALLSTMLYLQLAALRRSAELFRAGA